MGRPQDRIEKRTSWADIREGQCHVVHEREVSLGKKIAGFPSAET